MMDYSPEDIVCVTHIKEYTFCPRVFYYEACLPGLHHETVKTRAGRQAHDRERRLARRRSLAAYGLSQAKRMFDMRVTSKRWPVAGEIDEVLICPDEAIPIDYKNTQHLGYNFQLQLASYGLLLSDTTDLPVRRGFFYVIPQRKAEEVIFTRSLQRAARKTLEALYKIVVNETVPPPTRYRQRCPNCKFRRFCNDV